MASKKQNAVTGLKVRFKKEKICKDEIMMRPLISQSESVI